MALDEYDQQNISQAPSEEAPPAESTQSLNTDIPSIAGVVNPPPTWNEIKNTDKFKIASPEKQLVAAARWKDAAYNYASTLPDWDKIKDQFNTKSAQLLTDLGAAAHPDQAQNRFRAATGLPQNIVSPTEAKYKVAQQMQAQNQPLPPDLQEALDKGQPAPDVVHNTVIGTLAASAARNFPSTLAGLKAAPYGARIGALAGAAIPGLGETGIPEAVGGVLGGLVAFGTAAWAAHKLQTSIANNLAPDSVFGSTAEEQDAKDHPIAAEAGGLLAFGRPNPMNVVRAATALTDNTVREALMDFVKVGAEKFAQKNADNPDLIKKTTNIFNVVSAGGGNAMFNAFDQIQSGNYSPTDLAKSAAEGVLFNEPWIHGVNPHTADLENAQKELQQSHNTIAEQVKAMIPEDQKANIAFYHQLADKNEAAGNKELAQGLREAAQSVAKPYADRATQAMKSVAGEQPAVGTARLTLDENGEPAALEIKGSPPTEQINALRDHINNSDLTPERKAPLLTQLEEARGTPEPMKPNDIHAFIDDERWPTNNVARDIKKMAAGQLPDAEAKAEISDSRLAYLEGQIKNLPPELQARAQQVLDEQRKPALPVAQTRMSTLDASKFADQLANTPLEKLETMRRDLKPDDPNRDHKLELIAQRLGEPAITFAENREAATPDKAGYLHYIENGSHIEEGPNGERRIVPAVLGAATEPIPERVEGPALLDDGRPIVIGEAGKDTHESLMRRAMEQLPMEQALNLQKGFYHLDANGQYQGLTREQAGARALANNQLKPEVAAQWKEGDSLQSHMLEPSAAVLASQAANKPGGAERQSVANPPPGEQPGVGGLREQQSAGGLGAGVGNEPGGLNDQQAKSARAAILPSGQGDNYEKISEDVIRTNILMGRPAFTPVNATQRDLGLQLSTPEQPRPRSINDVIDNVLKLAKDPYDRSLLTKIKGLNLNTIVVGVKDLNVPDFKGGNRPGTAAYHPGNDVVLIHHGDGYPPEQNVERFTEEALHAATVSLYREGKTSAAQAFKTEVDRLYELAKAHPEAANNKYALANPEEFIGTGMGTEAGRKFLNSVKDPTSGQTILERLRSFLLRAMGIKPGSALETLTNKFFDVNRKDIPVPREMPTQPTLNIGHNTADGKGITPNDAEKIVEQTGAKVLHHTVRQSGTEPTSIMTLDRPLTEEEANQVSTNARQEAIAQYANGKGELYGPGAEKWKPFNQDYFLTHEIESSGGKEPFVHYSHVPDLKYLDPEKQGTGIAGEESRRRFEYPSIYQPRIYVGLEGYTKEKQLPDYRYGGSVDPAKLYDFAKDPEGFNNKAWEMVKANPDEYGAFDKKAADTLAEMLVKEAGYSGYKSGNIAALFDRTSVQRVLGAAAKPKIYADVVNGKVQHTLDIPEGATPEQLAAMTETINKAKITPEEKQAMLQQITNAKNAGGGEGVGVSQAAHEARFPGQVEPGTFDEPEVAMARARAQIASGVDPEARANELLKTDAAATPDDMDLFRAHLEDLSNAARAAEGTPAGKAALDKDLAFRQLIKPLQTKAGEALARLKGETDPDTGSFIGMQEAFVDRNNKPMTPPQEVKAKTYVARTQETQQQAEKALADVDARLAKEAKGAKLPTDPETLAAYFAAKRAQAGGGKNIFYSAAKVPFTPEERQAIWTVARDLFINPAKVMDLTKAAERTAALLGLGVDEVKSVFAGPKGKPMTDEVYRAMSKRNAVVSDAKRWLESANQPVASKVLNTVIDIPRTVAVFSHANAMITHGGKNLPIAVAEKILSNVFENSTMTWDTYADAFLKNFKFFWSKDADVIHAKEMESIVNHPLYRRALAAGLQVRPNSIEDYSSYMPQFKNAFLDKAGIGTLLQRGNWAMDSLKVFRMNWFAKNVEQFEGLPAAEQKAADKSMASIANHISGYVNIGQGALPNTARKLLFAPGLEASRWAWIGDYGKAVRTVTSWNQAGAGDKAGVKIMAARAGMFAATLVGALIANQAILKATGSDQQINLTDPTQSDWMRFKGANHTFDPLGGQLQPMRLLSRLAIIGTQQKVDPGSAAWNEIGNYLGGKATPAWDIGKEMITGKEFGGKPLPWSNAKSKQENESATEFFLQHAPIPVAEAAKAYYDQLSGEVEPDVAGALMNATFAGSIGYLGVKEGAEPKQPWTPHR